MWPALKKSLRSAWRDSSLLYQQLGLPRLIITSFVLLLFVLAAIMKMDLTILIGDSLVRIGMNGVLALSMLPTIACGVGLNFGLPVES